MSSPTRVYPQYRPLRALALAALLTAPVPAVAQGGIPATYRAAADSLIRGATRDSAAYDRLARLVDGFGHRQSGSRSLEAAIDWILSEMKKDGLENVRGEPVKVKNWVRGEESAVLVRPRRDTLSMLGLGGSVATPKGGITAPVLVVSSFEELERRRAEAKGKIVLFDMPFTNYGDTRRYRTEGPSAAARAGAVASLLRSVASFSIRSPHTGRTAYDSTAPRIPAAALSVEDAMMLRRMQARGEDVVLTLRMGARTLPPADSRNVVAELRGRELPDEVVVLGGHIDSWDVGQGAMDDGGGSVAAWEAVRLMRRLGLRPRRTVRVVLWTNEENGVDGGRAYRDRHAAELGEARIGDGVGRRHLPAQGLRVRRLGFRDRAGPPGGLPAGIHRRHRAGTGAGEPRGRHRADRGAGRAGHGPPGGCHEVLLVPPQPRATRWTSSTPPSWPAASRRWRLWRTWWRTWRAGCPDKKAGKVKGEKGKGGRVTIVTPFHLSHFPAGRNRRRSRSVDESTYPFEHPCCRLWPWPCPP